MYDDIFLYNEDILDRNFYNHFKDKFKTPGFGCFVWKPYIVLHSLERINDGDILQYTDVGCHLNPRGLWRLNEYINMVNSSSTGILAFQYKDVCLEKCWTKGDVFDYFGVRQREDVFNTGQVWAGSFFIKKNNRSIAIIKEWLKVFYDDFSLADTSVSRTPDFPDFIENRNDQSFFSVLAKINNVPTIDHIENYQIVNYPILALRDKGSNRTKRSLLQLKIKACQRWYIKNTLKLFLGNNDSSNTLNDKYDFVLRKDIVKAIDKKKYPVFIKDILKKF